MSAPAATVRSPVSVPSSRGAAELQARAKAESANAKIMPPWTMPKPLSISLRTRMVTCDVPFPVAASSIPSQADARSSMRSRW